MQYFGREASAFTKAALEGKTVLLQKDRTGDTVDRYGRWLRYVLLDGDNFNARLIRDGYAHAYRRFPFSKRRSLFNWKNKLGDGGSAYGTAAEIAGFAHSATCCTLHDSGGSVSHACTSASIQPTARPPRDTGAGNVPREMRR